MAQMVVVNCETGEQTVRDLTDEEETARAASVAEATAEREAAEAAATQAATDKAAGQDKLKALGLTDAEIAALVG